MPKQPSDPDFPHGKSTGYRNGCRGDYPCPATPTCAEAKRAENAARPRTTVPADERDWPQTIHVQRRLAETIEKVGIDALPDRTGLTLTEIGKVQRRRKKRIDPELAEPLDHAWSFFTRGVDTLAPDFKHGKRTSYGRYSCRCRACRTGAVRAQARTRAGIKSDHALTEVPGLAAHVRSLIAVAGPTPAARAAGVAVSVIRGAEKGARVRVGVARRLARTSPADVARTARFLPAARVNQRVRSMWALGYPLRWIAAQHEDLTEPILDRLARSPWVYVEVAAAIDAVADQVGDTQAGPEQGIDPLTAQRTRTHARNNGYYPPMFYDANGTLNPRAIPGHPWSETDDRCARALALARACAKGTLTYSQIGERYGRSHREVERMHRKIGLLDASDRAERAAWVLDLIDAYEAGERGPVEVALATGSRTTHGLAKDHPEVVAWLASQERKETAA